MDQLELFPDYKYECPHRDPRPMKWEFDNGYGRQNWNDGLYCSHCGFQCFYPNDPFGRRWADPADVDRSW